MRSVVTSDDKRLLITFGLSSLVSVGFFLVRVVSAETNQFWFLLWNLCLAWLPLIFAGLLTKMLPYYRWSSWQPLLITILWLGFLPNSFYLVSDFIHLVNAGPTRILYDAAMIMSFVFNGYALGYISLYLVHRQLLKRMKRTNAHLIIGGVLIACSFAIYMGRHLRWNTWDVLINPAGILFDVSDRIINPSSHPQTFTTTLTFFVLITSIYVVLWRIISILRKVDRTEGARGRG